jgi:hypothetical protein
MTETEEAPYVIRGGIPGGLGVEWANHNCARLEVLVDKYVCDLLYLVANFQ